jgi:hypothetical protein
MNLESLARAYVRCVELDDRAQSAQSELAEELSVLRGDLHALLMQALREAGIPFNDRSEAAHIAHEMVKGRSATSITK